LKAVIDIGVMPITDGMIEGTIRLEADFIVRRLADWIKRFRFSGNQSVDTNRKRPVIPTAAANNSAIAENTSRNAGF
jgi:hypothetical protein